MELPSDIEVDEQKLKELIHLGEEDEDDEADFSDPDKELRISFIRRRREELIKKGLIGNWKSLS